VSALVSPGEVRVEVRPGRWRLTSDLRFTLFGALWGLGLTNHLLQNMLEQQDVGGLSGFLELWRRVRPTIDWPSGVGVAILLVTLALAVGLLVLPWRRALFGLLAGPTLLLNVVSPERIPSHNSFMVAATLLGGGLVLGEVVERWARPAAEAERLVWYDLTLGGLRTLAVLTYLFAGLYKLNPEWLNPRTGRATEFLLEPLLPLAGWLGIADRKSVV